MQLVFQVSNLAISGEPIYVYTQTFVGGRSTLFIARGGVRGGGHLYNTGTFFNHEV